jgi:hypothetical protein
MMSLAASVLSKCVLSPGAAIGLWNPTELTSTFYWHRSSRIGSITRLLNKPNIDE